MHASCRLPRHFSITNKTDPDPDIGTMAEAEYSVDPEWAMSLLGLPMAVPEYWWPGFSRLKRFFGKIAKVNPRAENSAFFLLELNEEPGEYYAMRYDDVARYANTDDNAIAAYCLPALPPCDPRHEPAVIARTGRAPQRQKKRKIAIPVASRASKRRRRATHGKRATTTTADTDNEDDDDEVS